MHNRHRASETLGPHADEPALTQPKAEKTTLDLLGDTLCSASKKDNLTNEKREVSKSNRKLVKKAKTESLAEDVSKLEGLGAEECDDAGKKKAKYNLRDRADESDAQSDSEPSEDNLEEDQICRLIPKKWGKKRFLKGLDEKKKK